MKRIRGPVRYLLLQEEEAQNDSCLSALLDQDVIMIDPYQGDA